MVGGWWCSGHLDERLTRLDIRCHLRYVFVSFTFSLRLLCFLFPVLFGLFVCLCLLCLLISQLLARGFGDT